MKTPKIKYLCVMMALFLALVIQYPVLAHVVNGNAQCAETGRVPYGAVVDVFEVDPAPGGIFEVGSTSLATATVEDNGDFSLTFAWPSGTSGFEVGDPDLIFRLTQNINGATETIYEEDPTETHWNVVSGGSLSFEITSELAVFTDATVDLTSIPANSLFLFTRIGNCETADIDCKGSDSGSEGYYKPRKTGVYSGNNTDQPFGRTLDMFGWFGKLCELDYYKVQFSSDGTTWVDNETSLPNKWYDTSDPNSLYWKWVSQSMGPFSDDGIDNLYTIPFFVRPNTPWSYLDRVARFNTTMMVDGLSRIRIVGYKWLGSNLVEATSSDFTIDTNYGEIVLQIDNTAPSVDILYLKLNNSKKDVCEILSFGASDSISVYFRAYDLRGHLRDYTLNAMYGHDEVVNPKPSSPDPASDDYNSNATSGSTFWYGDNTYVTTYKGAVYGQDIMPTCAYQFRLDVDKRTTNGYGLIYHSVEDTWHVTIER